MGLIVTPQSINKKIVNIHIHTIVSKKQKHVLVTRKKSNKEFHVLYYNGREYMDPAIGGPTANLSNYIAEAIMYITKLEEEK